MPDDDITQDDLESGEESSPGGEPDDAPSLTKPAPQSLTADQVREAIASGNQEVIQVVQQAIQAIAANQQQGRGEPSEAPSGDFLDKLVADPDGVISSKIAEVMKNTLAQPLGESWEAARDDRIESRAAEIDLDWGDGFFDTNIRPRLVGKDGNLTAFPIWQQASPKTIDACINAIIGNDWRDDERRETLKEALRKVEKAKQEREVGSAPHLMGPGRPGTGKTDKLTPEMLDALSGFQGAGYKISEADVRAALTRDNTLDAYRSAKGGN